MPTKSTLYVFNRLCHKQTRNTRSSLLLWSSELVSSYAKSVYAARWLMAAFAGHDIDATQLQPDDPDEPVDGSILRRIVVCVELTSFALRRRGLHAHILA
jgi:hypothetical protein